MLASMDEFHVLDDDYAGRPVGSLEVATEALQVYSDHLTDLEMGRLHGWTLLGDGSFRTALLHIPTRTVYKLPRHLGEMGDANPAEAQFWAMMARHPEYTEFVPPHTLYRVVIGVFTDITAMAVPYLGNPSPVGSVPLELIHAAEHVGCFDACARNARFVSGRWYLIDASGNEHWDDPTMFGPGPGDGCRTCNIDYTPGGDRAVSCDF